MHSLEVRLFGWPAPITPNDFVEELLMPKYGVHQQFQIMTGG